MGLVADADAVAVGIVADDDRRPSDSSGCCSRAMLRSNSLADRHWTRRSSMGMRRSRLSRCLCVGCLETTAAACSFQRRVVVAVVVGTFLLCC